MGATHWSGDLVTEGRLLPQTTLFAIGTAGNVTYTAAQLISGFLQRDCNGAARADTTPTAAQILAAIDPPIVGGAGGGLSFEFSIRNVSGGAFAITVGAGAGVTLDGTMTIPQSQTRRFLAVVTNVDVPAVTIFSLGAIAH